jgi:hypothetical protein
LSTSWGRTVRIPEHFAEALQLCPPAAEASQTGPFEPFAARTETRGHPCTCGNFMGGSPKWEIFYDMLWHFDRENDDKQCEFGVPYSQTNLFLEHQDALDQFVEAAQSQGLIVALACFSQKRQNCVCPKIGETPMAILTSENDDKP